MKNTLRIAILFILIVVVFLAAALFALSRLRLDAYRTGLEAALTDALGVEVTISRLSLSWTTGPVVSVEGLFVSDPRLPGDYILFVPRVKTRLSLRSVLSDTLVVPHVLVEMPDVHLTEYRNGTSTWDLFVRGSSPEGIQASGGVLTVVPSGAIRTTADALMQRFRAADIIIERVTIDDGSLFYRREENTGVVETVIFSRGIDIILTSEGSPPVRSLLESPDTLSLAEGSMSGSIDHVNISGLEFVVKSFTNIVSDGLVTVKRVRIDAYEGTLDASGTMNITDPSFPATLALEVTDLAIHRLLNTFSDEKDLVVGTLEADGSFEFTGRSLSSMLSTIVGRGEFAITDGYITDFSIRKELADGMYVPEFLLPEELDTGAFDYLGGPYRVGNERIWFDDSRVTAPTYTAAAHGYVAFDETMDFAGEIYPSEEVLNTTKLQRLAELSGNENLFRIIPFTVVGSFDDVDFAVELNSPLFHRLLDVLKNIDIGI